MLDLPPYKLFPELVSKRVLLRELKSGELEQVLEIMTYDGKTVKNVNEGQIVQSKIDVNYLEGDGINWVIQDLDSKELVGFIGYYRGFTAAIGEIGFILKPGFRGKGFMSEAMQLATSFGIETIKLNQVDAYTKQDNKEAIAVLTRNGFLPGEEKHTGYLTFVYKS